MPLAVNVAVCPAHTVAEVTLIVGVGVTFTVIVKGTVFTHPELFVPVTE